VKHSKVFLFYFVAILLLAACAPVKWAMVRDKTADLKWPTPPNPVKVVYNGEISGFRPTGKSLFTQLFGRGKGGEIIKPVAVAVGGDGRIAIADAALMAVHLFVPTQQKYILLTHAGSKRLQSPVSVVFTRDLKLFVSDSVLRKVFLFNMAGKLEKVLDAVGNGTFIRPTGLTIRPDNNYLYVADAGSHRLEIFDPEGAYAGSFGKRGVGKGEFNFPTHLASDYKGQIYINDAMNFRVQVLSDKNKVSAMFGRHGNGSGDFAMSKGIAVDRHGTIYVVDTLFDRVQLFNIQGDYLMSFGGRGTAAGQFWLPSGVFIDDYHQQMYVCDTYNKRVQVFDLLDY
jgi:DNA-binding beta-propeller fold protein YncE